MDTNDHARYIILACTRHNKAQSSESNAKKPNPITARTGCKAKICAILYDNGKGLLTKVVVEHNHYLS